MTPRARPTVALALAAALLTAALLAVAGPAAGSTSDGGTPEERTETLTPIKHFITLMQENHSFDNYFGTYPGADGFPEGLCEPVDLDRPDAGCVEPYPIGDDAISDLAHSAETFEMQYNGGEMNGFVAAHGDRPADVAALAMGYYDDYNLPYYWNIADEYVLFDRFFTASNGGSVRNHFYWVTGTPGNYEQDSLKPEGFDEIPTIFDRLQEAGISWKFYVQNYNPEINFLADLDEGDHAQLVWVPLLNYRRFVTDPELSSRIVPLDEFYEDLENDTLPAVSYVVPSGSSEHPPGSIQAGERFVRAMLTSLMRSDSWESSAFMWTYDDWGGWYDHVEPPQVDEYGYGFRAPALLVSPYARRGHIDSTELDFTSMIAFITHNWGLEPLADRDRNATPFFDAFDFESDPRPAVLLGREREPPTIDRANAGVVYAAYGSSVAIAVGCIGLAAMTTWLTGRRRRST